MLLIDLRWKAADWLRISFFVRCFTKCWTRAPPLKLVKLVLVPIMQPATITTTALNVSSKWWDTQLLLIHMGDYSISSFCVFNQFSCMSHRLFQVLFWMLWPWKCTEDQGRWLIIYLNIPSVTTKNTKKSTFQKSFSTFAAQDHTRAALPPGWILESCRCCVELSSECGSRRHNSIYHAAEFWSSAVAEWSPH